MIFAIEIAQVTIAIGAALGAAASIYGTWRLARKDRSDDAAGNAAVLLGGWRDFQAETLKEVERVRALTQAQIAELKAEHEADRVQWDRDRERLQTEIDQLKAQIRIFVEREYRP